MHTHSETPCPRCGYSTKEDAALEVELAAIRKQVKQAGLALEPTAYAPQEACRRMGITRRELTRLLACGAVLDGSVGGRLRIPRSEVERWQRARR